ncbi:MAG: TldD/PmbA family protein [Pseudomonadota bacterium]
MERRDFLKVTGIGMGTLMLPVMGRQVHAAELQLPLELGFKKNLADAGLNAAKAAGATYADVRVGRYLNQFVVTRENKVQNIVNTESLGVGVRVIANGTWGFAATSALGPDDMTQAAATAVAIAKANSKYQDKPVELAPVKGVGEVSWRTPIEKNPFEVPIKDKVEMLMEVNAAAMEAGASFINSIFFLVNEQKYFASTDGSYIDQDVHRLWAPFFATVVDRSTGKFKTRNSLGSPVGRGWEYLDGKPEDKISIGDGLATVYDKSYDMVEDARNAAKDAREKLTAKSVEPGKYDLVLEPSHMWLTIHESVGHPLELDRVLGYEANFAGTSFATLDKLQSGDFQYGSEIVNLFADKTQAGSLGYVAYDDEGVATKQWDLVRDGVLVNYQAIRDQVQVIGQNESHGCCYADGWDTVQFQRMPNVSLEAGKQKLTPADMIKDVEKGVYIVGSGSFSIDQQRYNFQFGGQMFYEIENGEITGMLEDVTYQSTTQEFWNSCAAICDESDYRLGGSFFDGKGEPSQVSAVSHGSATTRFNGINVINSSRKI